MLLYQCHGIKFRMNLKKTDLQKQVLPLVLHAAALHTHTAINIRKKHCASATFYILTDNHELYQFLVARIKVPKEMRVSVLYTEDHVFIKEETRIGGNQDEWFPKSIVNVPESITTTE